MASHIHGASKPTQRYWRVTYADGLNVRAEPKNHSRIIGSLEHNDILCELETRDGYVRCERGWVVSELVYAEAGFTEPCLEQVSVSAKRKRFLDDDLVSVALTRSLSDEREAVEESITRSNSNISVDSSADIPAGKAWFVLCGGEVRWW